LGKGYALLPDNPVMALSYARRLAMSPDHSLRDGPAALAIALPLFQAQPTIASAETIAAALATAGNFKDAARWQEQVLQLAEKQGTEEAYIERQRKNMATYLAGQALP
jgi:hypothetical protein